MSTVTFIECDRCHHRSNTGDGWGIAAMSKRPVDRAAVRDEFDLCPRCYEVLGRVLDQLDPERR